jgi:hypothetical protein
MSTQIERDARIILSVLAAAPRNAYVPATDIASNSQLSPDRVNDGTAMLVEYGWAEWSQVMGTDPFDFGEAMITSRGRREFQTTAAAAEESKKAPEPTAARQSIQLFISHSSDDVELAGRLVTLISTALRLPASTIRCTSVDGYRLPAGANTNEQLRREVHESAAFIGIVSENSLRSMYVLFELGARWGAGRNLIPLLAHGVPSSSMSGPLSGINGLRADNSSQLHQLVQDLAGQLSVTPESPAVFDRALKDVLNTPVGKKPTAAPAAEATPAGEIPKDAENILVALSAEDGLTPEDLAEGMKCSVTKAQYLLDLLEEHHFVGSADYAGRSSEYYVDKLGRKYLVERGLIT